VCKRKSARSISSAWQAATAAAKAAACYGKSRRAPDFYKIVAIDVSYYDVELVPHARFDGAAAVAQLEAQIGLALGYANLFFVNEEKKW